jgi:hypothetical protein
LNQSNSNGNISHSNSTRGNQEQQENNSRNVDSNNTARVISATTYREEEAQLEPHEEPGSQRGEDNGNGSGKVLQNVVGVFNHHRNDQAPATLEIDTQTNIRRK